jgi:hypothetical protein
MNRFEQNLAIPYRNHPEIRNWIYLELPKFIIPVSVYEPNRYPVETVPDIHLMVRDYDGLGKFDFTVDVIGLRKPGKLPIGSKAE